MKSGMRSIARTSLIILALLGMLAPAAAVPPRNSVFVNYAVGSIVIRTEERHLFYVRGKNDVIVYPIAVGRAGRKWTGVTSIARKVRNPKWAPPPLILKEHPELPRLIGTGPNNPLGVAVLVLGDGTFGIHGTNRDETIGTDASYGCFRMHNADILSLFTQVEIGTPVYVQR
jgi:lipoprotein-anchoring transpeptidase ErfK/SrfK